MIASRKEAKSPFCSRTTANIALKIGCKGEVSIGRGQGHL